MSFPSAPTPLPPELTARLARYTLLADLDSKNGNRQQAAALMLGRVPYERENEKKLIQVVERLIPFVSRDVSVDFIHSHSKSSS
jgi:hypothetical protein